MLYNLVLITQYCHMFQSCLLCSWNTECWNTHEAAGNVEFYINIHILIPFSTVFCPVLRIALFRCIAWNNFLRHRGILGQMYRFSLLSKVRFLYTWCLWCAGLWPSPSLPRCGSVWMYSLVRSFHTLLSDSPRESCNDNMASSSL